VVPVSRAILALLLVTVGAAAQTAQKATCATCHRDEARSLPHTPMGIGIEVGDAQAVLKQNPQLTFEAHGYKYLIERKDGASTYTVTDGTGSLSLPIRYAFGVSSQTFVLEYNGRFYESLVSYYPTAGGLAITMGSERLRPRTLVEAMGRETSNDEIVSCFGCHSSGGVDQGKLALAAMRPGLDCEHCHTGAAAHQAAILEGKQTPMPKKLGELGAEDMSNFCGSCHRTWDTVLRMKTWGELNVRFQPYRLANSQCFMGNDRRIACTACHNPHGEIVRDAAAYDHNCLACHATQRTAANAKADASKVGKACPVAASKCVSCHMPKVELPGSHNKFTDHQIRIVRAGAPYPN